jgi:hypothetical protein
MKATLEARSWLRRRLRVDMPDGAFVVHYSGRGIGYESVWVNGIRVPARGDGLWFAPLFELPQRMLPRHDGWPVRRIRSQ